MIFEHDQKLSDALARYEAAHAQPLSEWERRLVRAVREWDVARRAGEAGEKQAGAEPSGDGLPAAGERMEQAYDSGGPGGPAQRPEGVRSSPAPPAEPAPPTATPPDHEGWERVGLQECVECERCGFTMAAHHLGSPDQNNDCPEGCHERRRAEWAECVASSEPTAPPTAAPADDDLHFAPCRCDKCREILLGEKPKTPRVSPERRVSDADVARIVARTPVEFECDATAYENLALDLRDARAQLAEARDRLRIIAQSCHTLSPQEFLNHCQIGRGQPLALYSGEVDANRSLYEREGELRRLTAQLAEAREELHREQGRRIGYRLLEKQLAEAQRERDEARRDATLGTPLFNDELRIACERAEAAERDAQALRERCAKWAEWKSINGTHLQAEMRAASSEARK